MPDTHAVLRSCLHECVLQGCCQITALHTHLAQAPGNVSCLATDWFSSVMGGLLVWSCQSAASGLYCLLHDNNNNNAVNVQLASPKSATITTTFPAAQVAQPFAGMLCML